MQRIERSDSQATCLASRQLGADFKREVRETNLGPNPCRAVGVEVRPHSLGLMRRQLTPEDVLRDGVGELRTVQRRQPNNRFRSHPPGLGRVSVPDVEGNNQTRVGVDAQ